MYSNQKYTNVQTSGKLSMTVIMTEQLRELELKKGDKVFVAVETVNGKKRIIVEDAAQR